MKSDKRQETWQLLASKGFSFSERMKIENNLIDASGFKESNPFIERVFKKGKVSHYKSKHEMINHFIFETENEVVLANAIYLNMEQDANVIINDFIDLFKFTCRIIGLKSKWA